MFLDRLFYEEISSDEVCQVKTPDGATIFLYRYLPKVKKFSHPVFFCHGLGASRYNFGAPGWDWARRFAQSGWDVWLIELRGSGRSTPPRRWHWTFDDYLTDIETALDYILSSTGSSKVHWVGHSMGGLLFYAYAGTKRQEQILSGVTMGSPVRFLPETLLPFRLPLKISWLMNFLPYLPVRTLVQWTIPLFPYCSFLPVYSLHFNVKNVNLKKLWKVTYCALSNIAIPLMRQFEYWARNNCFDSFDHKENYQQAITNIHLPVLVISGEKDLMAHPKNVQYAFELLAGEKKLVHLSRAQGFSADYGHIDMVFGHRAMEEVLPLVEEWLREHEEVSHPLSQGGLCETGESNQS